MLPVIFVGVLLINLYADNFIFRFYIKEKQSQARAKLALLISIENSKHQIEHISIQFILKILCSIW